MKKWTSELKDKIRKSVLAICKESFPNSTIRNNKVFCHSNKGRKIVGTVDITFYCDGDADCDLHYPLFPCNDLYRIPLKQLHKYIKTFHA